MTYFAKGGKVFPQKLNMAYKHLSFLEAESPKLLFADDVYQRSGYQRAN